MSRRERRRLRQQQQGAGNAPSSFEAEMVPNQDLPAQQPRSTPATTRRLMMEFQAFAGPIPPPEILGKYEEVCPGSSGRILTQFEEQGRHRRALERKALNYNVASAAIGQFTGFALFLAAIGAGVFLLDHDKSVEGIVSIISAVGGAAWVLQKAETAKKTDLAHKREEGRKR